MNCETAIASVMHKILCQNVAENTVPILSKVRLKRDKPPIQLEDKTSVEVLQPKKRRRAVGRVKPDAASLERERQLQNIATKGVVELFNVVRKQQKSLQAKLQEAGSSEVKKSKGTHIQLPGDASTHHSLCSHWCCHHFL